jgi:hypothetical protein
MQYIPWLQAKLWNAEITETGITCQPVHLGNRTPETAVILAPEGPVKMVWDKGKATTAY